MWTLGATAQRRHRLDVMTTRLSTLSLRATVREPLGLLTRFNLKLHPETANLVRRRKRRERFSFSFLQLLLAACM